MSKEVIYRCDGCGLQVVQDTSLYKLKLLALVATPLPRTHAVESEDIWCGELCSACYDKLHRRLRKAVDAIIQENKDAET